MDAFYEPVDEHRFQATELTRGPWDPAAQHAGPPAALLGRELERCGARDGAQIVRVTVEILRPVMIGPMETQAQVLRPGRNIELLAGELRAGGETVLRANAWRMRTADVGVSVASSLARPPGPEVAETSADFPWSAAVGYHTAIEWRFVSGHFTRRGRATVWMRMRQPLVAGEPPSPLTRVLAAADSGNGVSAALDFSRYVFVNMDLTVALHRLPAGEWVCLDARSTIEPHGIGLAQSQLFDEQGPLGTGLQNLFVAVR